MNPFLLFYRHVHAPLLRERNVYEGLRARNIVPPMCGRFVQTPIRDAASLGFPQLVGDLLPMPASCRSADAPTSTASPSPAGEGHRAVAVRRVADHQRPDGPMPG